MHRSVRLGLLAAGACLLVHSGVFGDDAPEVSRQPSIADLLNRIETLEQDKVVMQEDIHELRAQLDDDWLTEQRVEEIRTLVSDMLADADVRASLLQDTLTAGWADHFFLASPDGRFKLQLEGQLQLRWVWNFHDQADRYRAGFENTRTKLAFRGHMFTRDLTYLVRGDFGRAGGTFLLQDAWVRYHLNNEWSVRLGQFKLPFNREELVSSTRQLAVERSLVNESLNLGRSQGIELAFADAMSRFSIAFSDSAQDQVGGFNLVGTIPANTTALSQDTEFTFTSRIERLVAGNWRQFEDFTSPPDEQFGMLVGLAGHVQHNEFNGGFSFGRNENRWVTVAGDVSMEWGGANVFLAASHHYIDNTQFGQFSVFGAVAQGGVYFTPKFEAFARFEFGTFETDVSTFTNLYVLTLGGNYYFDGHDVKLSADIGFGTSRVESTWDSDIAGWRIDGSDAEPQVVIRTQLQLLF